MRKAVKRIIQVGGTTLPVSVAFDLASGHRYSISTRSVRMRLPVLCNEAHLQEHLLRCSDWVAETLESRPDLKQAFLGKQYRQGDILKVGLRKYFLDFSEKVKATNTAKLIGDTISLEINPELGAWQRSRVIKTLLSRVVARDFQDEVTHRVQFWNDRTFRQPIKQISLKYNHSNWGSCSARGNLNLSTRLLFAPADVQDYVILHELAHLIELNHSDRFWALVERHMPDYRKKEAWLKKNRAACDF